MRKKKAIEQFAPTMVSTASTVGTTNLRRNLAGSVERTDRFRNIDDGLVPFRNTTYGQGKSSVEVRDAVILCQKCYYNFAIFRNIIDLMTEFSVSNLFFKGGSQKSRDFFSALWKKINIWDLEDRFYREYYRSGNIFLYRFDAEIKQADVAKITQVFAEDSSLLHNSVEPLVEDPVVPKELPIEKLKIPSRYIILNPADIQMMGTANFGWALYYKILTDYELARLKHPQTDEDVEILNSLPAEIQKDIMKGLKAVMIPLDPAKVSAVFYKKQDYEPFAVPMGYPVLEDINAKAEMKKIDMAIARTMQQIILLVTAGAEPEKGGINPNNLKVLNDLFRNTSVGRVLVADYTTKAQFVVPDISELLTPEKYVVLDKDINIGLNNIFAGEEKFANQAQKVELFVERLEQGRQAFLNNFLIPEVKRIAKAVGFKNFPTPYFEDIKLKDNTNYAKIFARLIEIGVLTPEQGLKAIETNTLPEAGSLSEDQKVYKAERDKGFYQPLVGGAKGQDAGRPQGSPGPRQVSPIGTNAQEEKFSLTKIKDNLLLAQELETNVISYLKEKFDVRKLTKAQKEVSEQIAHLIFANEDPAQWKESIAHYCGTPIDKNKERVAKVIEIAATHHVDEFLASILLASKIDGQTV